MYSKTEGHNCWWLNKDGKALANFENESDVDDIVTLFEVEIDVRATLNAANKNNRILLDNKKEMQKKINKAISCVHSSQEEDVGYDVLCSLGQNP
jgi:hypothetical protein